MNPVAGVAKVISRKDTIESVLRLIEELQVAVRLLQAQVDAVAALPAVEALRQVHNQLPKSEEYAKQQIGQAQAKLNSMVAWSADARKAGSEEKEEKSSEKEEGALASVAGRILHPKEEAAKLQIHLTTVTLALSLLNTALSAATLSSLVKA